MIAQSHGNSTNITQRELDRRAIARADEMDAVEQGRLRLRQLEAKWRTEGRQMFLDGMTIGSCWNHIQEEGYREAEAEYEAIVHEQDRKPELGVDYEPVSEYELEVS